MSLIGVELYVNNYRLYVYNYRLYVYNYRPITVLPAVSKIYERILSSKVICYMDDILSPYFCAYRKGHNTQHVLLRLIEKCRSSLAMKGFTGAVLMDLLIA